MTTKTTMNEMNTAISKSEINSVMSMIQDERLQLYQPQLKYSSMNAFINNWNRLLKYLGAEWSDDGLPNDWWVYTDKVLQMIEGMKDSRNQTKPISGASKRNYVSALIQIGQVNGVDATIIKTYMDARSEMNKTISGTSQSEESKELLVTQEEVKTKVFDVLEQGNYIWSNGMPVIQYYILMKLHSEHNLRNDACSLHWITQQQYRGIGKEQRESKNWLLGRSLGKGNHTYTIELNQYKTKKEGDKPVSFPLSLDMNKMMNKYLKDVWMKHYNTGFQLQPVFVKGLNSENVLEPISSNDMTLILQKNNQIYLGKKIGTKMLRHSFYTEKYSEVGKELKVDAQNSLHSISTAINHYTHLTTEDETAIKPLLKLDDEVTPS